MHRRVGISLFLLISPIRNRSSNKTQHGIVCFKPYQPRTIPFSNLAWTLAFLLLCIKVFFGVGWMEWRLSFISDVWERINCCVCMHNIRLGSTRLVDVSNVMCRAIENSFHFNPVLFDLMCTRFLFIAQKDCCEMLKQLNRNRTTAFHQQHKIACSTCLCTHGIVSSHALGYSHHSHSMWEGGEEIVWFQQWMNGNEHG